MGYEDGERKIPRREIAGVSHPGSVEVVSGLLLMAGGASLLALTDWTEQDECRGMECEGAGHQVTGAVYLGFGLVATGVTLFTGGAIAHQRSVSRYARPSAPNGTTPADREWTGVVDARAARASQLAPPSRRSD